MNREKCKQALNGLRILEREENFKKWNQVAPQIKCDVIELLIHEHYDNPPLKFEELVETETYYHVYYGWISIRSLIDNECILINTLNSDGYKQIEFEEDSFYRKQVE